MERTPGGSGSEMDGDVLGGPSAWLRRVVVLAAMVSVLC